MLKLASSLLVLTALAAATTFALSADQPVIGLITKTDTNPFFVKMKEGATQMAKDRGARLLTAAGKQDGDNAAQVTAMENMMTAGAKTIMLRTDVGPVVMGIFEDRFIANDENVRICVRPRRRPFYPHIACQNLAGSGIQLIAGLSG